MFVCLFPTSMLTWRRYLFSVTFLRALHTVYIHNKYKLLQGLETVRPPRISFFLHFWKDRIARHVFKSPSALPKVIFKITDQITIKKLRIELLKDPHLIRDPLYGSDPLSSFLSSTRARGLLGLPPPRNTRDCPMMIFINYHQQYITLILRLLNYSVWQCN